MNFEFFEFDRNCHKEWDDFMLKTKNGSVHQISTWKKFQQKIPGRENVFGFGVRENGKIVAATFCVFFEIDVLKKFFKKRNFGFFYSARGPVFNMENKDAGKFLIEEIAKILPKKIKDSLFWRFDPAITETDYEVLNLQKVKPATKNFQPTDTLEINLKKSDDEILAEMKRKGRYNINLARKKRVKIEIFEKGSFGKQEIGDFWKLNVETTSRDEFFGHDKEYYENFLRTLEDNAVLFFATFEGERITSAISTFFGKNAIYYFGASTSQKKYRNLMAPYLLQWEMMQFSRKRGCETYDFLGIAPEGAENHQFNKISEFKWKFGGKRKTVAEGKEIPFSKFWYFLYRVLKRKSF
jgi:lipid II:glycine glycyltransferase (peptidoglycan interpeptide bridge formation enzyme)